ncbi:hypothetical protein [Streptomyces sp. NPDC005262]|uniref:hypothetical protein n=1 Tax=Streptomyces sp. NPDC005262 TaxID=3364710 RepID=UPI0036900A84
MSEIQAHATGLTSQYIAQVTGDLERNVKEQERIGAEVEALQEQLGSLQHDHSVLVSMREALGGSNAVDEADTTAAPTVPRQATAEPRQSKPKKAAATSAKTTASKKNAAKAPSATTSSAKATSAKAPSATTSSAKATSTKATKTDTKPTLVNLIRGHLEQQSEPRSATEVSAALTQAHPERGVKTTVVRTTLEGLVAKSQAQRTKQGSSVFYTATAASETAATEPQQEAVAG